VGGVHATQHTCRTSDQYPADEHAQPLRDGPREKRYNDLVSERPEAQEPDLLFSDPSPRWATLALIALNTIIAIFGNGVGSTLGVPSTPAAIDAGAVEPMRVWSGEVWRLLTASFVHLGAWHLLLNLWTLWVVGRALERLVGGARVLLVYLVSGVGGFALSLCVEPGITAGASGAIFGITGGLFALAWMVRGAVLGRYLTTVLVPFIIATLVLGWLLPFVNNTAHVGGFLFGALLTYGWQGGSRAFLMDPHNDDGRDTTQATNHAALIPRSEQILAPIALLLCLVLLMAVSAYAVAPQHSPRYRVLMAIDAMARNDEVDARLQLEHAKALAPSDALTSIGLGLWDANQGRDASARNRIQIGLRGLDDGQEHDAERALAVAQQELLLLATTTAGETRDDATSSALCDAVLSQVRGKASTLRNNCAWLWATTSNHRLRQTQRAVDEAWQAALDSKLDPNIVHTYVRALGANGDFNEALRWLEVLAIDGHRGELARAGVSLAQERIDLERMRSRNATTAQAQE
jgi:membrane associated rhomboid family serine protease